MNSKICIVCVAFGERYIEQQARQIRSIAISNPDAEMIIWTDALPNGSKPFKVSLYGFKVHAVLAALAEGFKKIVFLDPACIVEKPLDYYFTLGLPVIAAKDDNALVKFIGDKALQYYGNPDITGWHLVGGSLYAFDFTHPNCRIIFDHWAKAESDGIFGSQRELSSEQINKHRNDESCMAMSLYMHGYEPLPLDQCKYRNGEDSIIQKEHFK